LLVFLLYLSIKVRFFLISRRIRQHVTLIRGRCDGPDVTLTFYPTHLFHIFPSDLWLIKMRQIMGWLLAY